MNESQSRPAEVLAAVNLPAAAGDEGSWPLAISLIHAWRGPVQRCERGYAEAA